MFTGLVEGIAKATRIDRSPEGIRIQFCFNFPNPTEKAVSMEKRSAETSGLDEAKLGDSVSISGCCLTVVDVTVSGDSVLLSFEAGTETLSKTGLGKLMVGDWVNFERSLRVGDRMGGHFVTGHVDGRGRLERRVEEGHWAFFHFSAPPNLLVQMVDKGSITIDGVSLTIVQVTKETFHIALIPHTLSVTTLGQLKVGDEVNLETDILAKYVQRMGNMLSG